MGLFKASSSERWLRSRGREQFLTDTTLAKDQVTKNTDLWKAPGCCQNIQRYFESLQTLRHSNHIIFWWHWDSRMMFLRTNFNLPQLPFGVGFIWKPRDCSPLSQKLVCPHGREQICKKRKSRGLRCTKHFWLPALKPEIGHWDSSWWCILDGLILAFISSPLQAEDLGRLPGREVLLLKVPVAVMRCSDRWKRWDINEAPNNFQLCTKWNHPAARLPFEAGN